MQVIKHVFHKACLIYNDLLWTPLEKIPGSALGMDPYPFCIVNDRMMSLTCIKFEDLKSFGQGKPARTTLGDIDQFFSQTHQATFKQSTVHHDFA